MALYILVPSMMTRQWWQNRDDRIVIMMIMRMKFMPTKKVMSEISTWHSSTSSAGPGQGSSPERDLSFLFVFCLALNKSDLFFLFFCLALKKQLDIVSIQLNPFFSHLYICLLSNVSSLRMVIPLKTHAVRLSNSASSHCVQNKSRHVQTYARSQTSSKADVEFEVGFQERAHVHVINLWSKALVRLLLTKKRKRGGQTMGRRYVIITAEGNITSPTVKS